MANRFNGYLIGNDRCQPFGRDEKLERAKTLCAYAGANYRRHEDWAGEVLKLTDGAGVDHVLDVGGAESFAQSLRAVRRGGQINVIGYLGGTTGATNPLDIFRRQVRVRGIPAGSRASFKAMNRAISGNALRSVIERSYAWTDIEQAPQGLASGANFGKIVLQH